MNVNNTAKLDYYMRFKTNSEYDKYIDVIKKWSHSTKLNIF